MHAIRDARPDEAGLLGLLWHDAWHESHAPCVPPPLTRLRSLESFQSRIARMLANTRVACAGAEPVGFRTLKDDELHQIFVRADARGTGAAAALLADGETGLRRAGVRTAWLACAVGNDWAARFYEKHGWHVARTEIEQVETGAGESSFPLRVRRYEKRLDER
ncbi:GNAT family N-acetyltransferase [Minwuia thermotolerans]|uniref:GNAT family N-acetyltransferase n=1 Tax=Minwuia thermotolerans TaxID=2056226 RepID=A0A2M9FYZ1_9PROT|nr:GNAT family N-acetyltransferase [Minwuia thermotolerans]PJK28677.1 GNAT family N-acetyltransferase [Minwuia thermotolerans]